MCVGLSNAYVEKSFFNSDALIVISSNENTTLSNNGSLIFGFALLKFNDNNSLKIDIICSNINISGGGDVLMKSLEELCRKVNIEKIKLESVNNAVSFYEKYDFVKQDLCDDPLKLCDMTKIILNAGGKNRIKKLKSIKSIKSIKIKSKKNKIRKHQRNHTKKQNKK